MFLGGRVERNISHVHLSFFLGLMDTVWRHTQSNTLILGLQKWWSLQAGRTWKIWKILGVQPLPSFLSQSQGGSVACFPTVLAFHLRCERGFLERKRGRWSDGKMPFYGSFFAWKIQMMKHDTWSNESWWIMYEPLNHEAGHEINVPRGKESLEILEHSKVDLVGHPIEGRKHI